MTVIGNYTSPVTAQQLAAAQMIFSHSQRTPAKKHRYQLLSAQPDLPYIARNKSRNSSRQFNIQD
ncbi:MAG: hypothetical protein OFPII_39290 [Osedax symbiont Rs1]|nr:MAG: hypothetical protein OFPII_39290 [Osedax symbiont Rs1]